MTNDELDKMATLLRTQDNSSTSHPMFLVQQKRRIYECSNDDTWTWMDGDWNEVDADEVKRLDEAYENQESTDGFTRVTYTEIWEFVTCCLTNEAAERYIAAHKHNLHEPRVYVDSGYGNEEWIAIRKHFMERKVDDHA